LNKKKRDTTINKISLYSEDNNSFHVGLKLDDAWDLMQKIARQSWFLETGLEPPVVLDKSIFKITKMR
jgi:hypothetical protein